MAEPDPINVFLNEASKTAEARVNIIREVYKRLTLRQREELIRSLCMYDRRILKLDMEGTY